MRDKKRIKRILNKIEKVWNIYPDQRFFQLLFNYTQLGTRTENGSIKDPFRYGDEELEDILNGLNEILK